MTTPGNSRINLATDIGETTNLAAEQPGKVAELVATIAKWEMDTVEPAFPPRG